MSDRVLFFNEEYKEGFIRTELVKYEDKQIIVKACVTPDQEFPHRYFTGYAQEVEGDGFINKTSALENAETSAVGRALAMMGIGVIDSIASIDEINKANNRNVDIKTGEVLDNGKCEKCGASMKLKKDGSSTYCSRFCWKIKPPKIDISKETSKEEIDKIHEVDETKISNEPLFT